MAPSLVVQNACCITNVGTVCSGLSDGVKSACQTENESYGSAGSPNQAMRVDMFK